MRAYGIPRNHDAGNPDAADVRLYGLAGRAGRLPGPGGDVRSPQRASAKARARRTWKRCERRAGRAACAERD